MKGDEIYTNTFITNFKIKKIHYIVQKIVYMTRIAYRKKDKKSAIIVLLSDTKYCIYRLLSDY